MIKQFGLLGRVFVVRACVDCACACAVSISIGERAGVVDHTFDWFEVRCGVAQGYVASKGHVVRAVSASSVRAALSGGSDVTRGAQGSALCSSCSGVDVC